MIESAAAVQNLDHIFREDERKLLRQKLRRFRSMHDRFRSKRSIIGKNQFDICAPTQRAEQFQTADGGEISRLEPQTMIVERAKGRVADFRRRVDIDAGIILNDSGRLIFKPSLISGDLTCLRRTHAAEILLALPTLPREFVV